MIASPRVSSVPVRISAALLCGLSGLLGLASAAPARGQSSAVPPPAAPLGRPPAFEVVSIRRSGKDTGISFGGTPDGFRATHQTLWSLIAQAYLPMPLWGPDRIKNLPDWATREEYDVQARVAPEDVPAWQRQVRGNLRQLMLQAMLAERCKLVLHTVPAEVPGFAVVVAKSGSRLKIAAPQEVESGEASGLAGSGFPTYSNAGETPGWVFHAASITSLLDFLSIGAHTLVQDHTGLTGRYDFTLARRSDADPLDHGDRSDPSQRWEFEPLGLRIVPAKVSTVTLMIDHLERPSEN